jgi:hypothetical protein
MGDYRPCGRGSRCSNPTLDAAGVPAARWGPGAFCASDTRLISEALAGLPRLYTELSLALPRTAQANRDTQVTGSTEAPTPLNLAVEALMRELVMVLVTWEEVCLEPPLPAGATRPGYALARACAALRADLGALLALPRGTQARHGRLVELDGVDAGLDVLRLHHRAGRLLQAPPTIEVRPAPCPACGMYALLLDAATRSTRCQGCRHVISEQQYDAWCGQLTGHGE